jgi:hypothetical protein
MAKASKTGPSDSVKDDEKHIEAAKRCVWAREARLLESDA